MRLKNYRDIENWTEDDLSQLPSQEDDYWEYKSSLITAKTNWQNELNEKLCHAASAFWNTGGGVFLVGIDGTGVIDGGIPSKIGRQTIRDWVDATIRDVQPTGAYAIGPISGNTLANSLIKPNCIVLAVAFDESYNVPHMSAQDNKYYVRAGAHTVPAGHYLVEAIRSRRGLQNPMLLGLIRRNVLNPRIVELVIISANSAPAFNVVISFDPMPKMYEEHAKNFVSMNIPMLDRENPTILEIALETAVSETFGDAPVNLLLDYENVLGQKFHESQLIDLFRLSSPIEFGKPTLESAIKSVESLSKQVTRLTDLIGKYQRNPPVT